MFVSKAEIIDYHNEYANEYVRVKLSWCKYFM